MTNTIFDSLERSIGRANAIKLISNMPRRGKRSRRVCFYIPKQLSRDHMLVDMLGYDLAHKLSNDLGGLSVQTTSGRSIYKQFRNRTIKRLFREGLGFSEIAVRMNLSNRMVRYIVEGPSQGGVPCG